MTTIKKEDLRQYLNDTGLPFNLLLSLPPVSLGDTKLNTKNGQPSSVPDALREFIETIAISDECCHISRFSKDTGMQIYALFSSQGKRSCGYLSEETDTTVTLVNRKDLLRQLGLDFVKYDANETQEIKKIVLPPEQALVFAILLDLYQSKRSGLSDKTIEPKGITRAEILKVIRSLTSAEDQSAGSAVKTVKIENYPLTLLTSTFSTQDNLDDAAVGNILTSLTTSGHVRTTGKSWLPDPALVVFVLDPALERILLSLNHSYLTDGLLDSMDAFLVINNSPDPAVFIRSTSGGVEWTAYSSLAVVQYLEFFLVKSTSYSAGNRPGGDATDTRSQSTGKQMASKKKIPPLLIILLAVSLLTMLCSCGVMSFGLFLS